MKARGTDRKSAYRAVSFWLSEDDLAELKAIAREKGIGHTTLIRMWVKERLKREKNP